LRVWWLLFKERKTMKVILDECIPQAVRKFLEKKGVDTSSATGLRLPDKSDQMILEYASVGADILITSDRRMKSKNKFPSSPKVGVVYVRVEPWTSRFQVSALDEFLRKESLKNVVGKSLILRRHDWEFLE
jgi:predicted nuclease of predicted toxin-antitoxin system